MIAGKSAPRVRPILSLIAIAALVLAGAATSAWAQFAGYGGLQPAPATGFAGWLLGQQAFFYQALAGMLRAAKTNGSAYWGLIGVSFIYGIFHAAGPGHGKAVISSYLLANEQTWRRGVVLSFASAVLQSFTAVVIVAIAALLIGATAKMMGDAVRGIEIVSYLLIILVGARLLWVKGKAFAAALRKTTPKCDRAKRAAASRRAHEPGQSGDACRDHQAHAYAGQAHNEPSDGVRPLEAQPCGAYADHDHRHGHHHDDDGEGSILPWGHAHGPQPEELAGPGGWRRGFLTVTAVGLRPCSGAIIVLVFALAQGLFWAGVASTFVMGLGTAITVAGIASFAVGAKSLAKRFATGRAGYGTLVLRGFEAGAACLVILVGIALLTGYMASEQLGFF
jgi:nickel/cobalt transporter (NicO) family protein